MAEVTGPISTLPGAVHRLPEGTMCDRHQDRPAVKRVQGETDSMGSELNDMCHQCYDRHLSYLEKQRSTLKYCEWCKSLQLRVRPHRDMDEGMSGPLYDVCGDCITAENVRAAEELAESGHYADDDYFLDDDYDHDADPILDGIERDIAFPDHRAEELNAEQVATDIAVAKHHHEPPNPNPVVTYMRPRLQAQNRPKG